MKRPSRIPFPFNGLPLLLVAALLAAALLPAGYAALTPTPVQAAASAPHAPTVAKWYDGLIQYSTITNCVSIIQGSPYHEYGVGTFMGFRADPDNALPAPGMPYYIHVVVAGMGNACSGMRVYLDVGCPPTPRWRFRRHHPVYCYLGGAPITPASTAPKPCPPPATTRAPSILSPDSAHAYLWPLPQGGTLEFQIPVRSSTALTNSTLQAHVWVIDGNSSPLAAAAAKGSTSSAAADHPLSQPVDHRDCDHYRPLRGVSLHPRSGRNRLFRPGYHHRL